MKIAFFGQRKFFDYFLIGGFQSYIRRLAQGLAQRGHEIEYVLYDAPQEKGSQVAPRLTLAYCRTFDQGLTRVLTGNYDHVLRVWLSRQDRLRYIWAIRRHGPKTKWHQFCLAWPDAPLKRSLVVLDSYLSPFRGMAFCVSYRQYSAIKNYQKNAYLALPPVPEEYFLTPVQKGQNSRINVTFLGNLTPDKFGAEVIALFEKLQPDSRFRFSIYGTHDRSNPLSVKMHNYLQRQKAITYVHVDMEGYSLEIDALVRRVLQETDVFVQPYRTLQNTLDTPLLLLEAMASLCAVMTTPLGSVQDIYGRSRFLLPAEGFPERVENVLTCLTWESLLAERNRILERNRKLRFHQTAVLENLLAVLESY